MQKRVFTLFLPMQGHNYKVTKVKTGAMIKLREELTQLESRFIQQILLPLQLTKIFN